MIAPDITAAPVCCAKCRQPVKIVCDAHGTDCVLELPALPRQETAFDAPARRAASTPATTPPRQGGERQAQRLDRVCAAVSIDAEHPSTTPALAAALDITTVNVANALGELVKLGRVRRVAWGQYVQTLGAAA